MNPSCRVVVACTAAVLAVVASPAQSAPPPASVARMPLNPQPLPPRWSAGPIAKPAGATNIIIVGGRSGPPSR